MDNQNLEESLLVALELDQKEELIPKRKDNIAANIELKTNLSIHLDNSGKIDEKDQESGVSDRDPKNLLQEKQIESDLTVSKKEEILLDCKEDIALESILEQIDSAIEQEEEQYELISREPPGELKKLDRIIRKGEEPRNIGDIVDNNTYNNRRIADLTIREMLGARAHDFGSILTPLKDPVVSEVEDWINEYMITPNREAFVITNQEIETESESEEYTGKYINQPSKIPSSPTVIFGPETISMVDEFLKKEEEMKEEDRQGIIRKIFRFLGCCK